MSSERIGFVGAGRMGRPMVVRLAAAGADLRVHARREQARADLASVGVRGSADLAEVARHSDLLIVCVFDDEQLAAVLPTAVAALPDGAVLALHTTTSVRSLRELTTGFERIAVVDAPVSGTPSDIAAGRLTVLLGGSPAARGRVASVVGAYADPVIETGPSGTAMATKLVNNLLFAANAQLIADAVSLGAAAGVTQPALLAAIEHMSGGSEAARRVAEQAELAAYATRVRPFLGKDVDLCRRFVRECGVEPGLLFDVVDRGPLSLT